VLILVGPDGGTYALSTRTYRVSAMTKGWHLYHPLVARQVQDTARQSIEARERRVRLPKPPSFGIVQPASSSAR